MKAEVQVSIHSKNIGMITVWTWRVIMGEHNFDRDHSHDHEAWSQTSPAVWSQNQIVIAGD